MTDKINEFFDMTDNVENELEEIDEHKEIDIIEVDPVIHHPTIKQNALDDYNATRDSMKAMITKGTVMIDDLIKVTKESESPRAYEVLSGYMKTIAEMNKTLMDIHKNTKEITEEKNEKQHQETNNYVYVGSTEDLQKELEAK